MVCSQDIDLRRELRRVGGVPTFFFSLDIKFDIEEPSKVLISKLNRFERQKFLPTPREYKVIAPVKQEQREKTKLKKKIAFEHEKNYLGVRVRKYAKGPNPLSIKRKKMKLDCKINKNIFIHSALSIIIDKFRKIGFFFIKKS